MNQERFLQDYCDRCRKKFDQEEWIIIKVPERIYFCIKCIEELPDDKSLWRLAVAFGAWRKLLYTEIPNEEQKDDTKQVKDRKKTKNKKGKSKLWTETS